MSDSHNALARSVHARLVRYSKQIGVDSNLILTRYAIERFLFRLSRSPHADRFVLKGALLLLAWLGETLRPTRDADLLGFGEISDESLKGIIGDICVTPVERDAMVYSPETIQIVPIRPEDAYGGRRVVFQASLGSARLRVQVDVGVGDAVVPEPEWLDYPSLLDSPSPRLRVYPPEVAIAEKLHAMVLLGSRNSRMRDFFDVHALASRRAFDGDRLVRAVRATFDRRRTPIPDRAPIALTPAFAEAEGKQAQWSAFLERSRIAAPDDSLKAVIALVAVFIEPVLDASRNESNLPMTWIVGGPWRETTG